VEPVRESYQFLLESFKKTQLRRVGQLVGLARELTGEYFGLGVDEARKVPYEVRTLTHLDEPEIYGEGVLADIARYQYLEPRFGRKRDLYRVNLQDHNILNSLRRSTDRVQFSPLLLYILTHEIVHVIRFVKFLTPFHLTPSHREEEEQRVHALTRSILARVPIRGMGRVLREYENMTFGENAL
jgi:hypothetical protein